MGTWRLRAIQKGCSLSRTDVPGYACVMPMRKVGTDWEPTEPGWGLLDARTLKPINPAALISDEKIVMTDWELQDFAVQVVREQLAKEGRRLMSWNGDPRVNPSIWFVGDADPERVVVRAVRYPAAEANLPNNLAEMKAHFNKLGHLGYFASVSMASVDDPFDP